MKTIQPTPPTIPDACTNFAKAVAALADAHGIKSFEMKMLPDFGDDYDRARTIQGDLIVRFWTTDGRGRPSRNIRIQANTAIHVAVEYTPESVS